MMSQLLRLQEVVQNFVIQLLFLGLYKIRPDVRVWAASAGWAEQNIKGSELAVSACLGVKNIGKP